MTRENNMPITNSDIKKTEAIASTMLKNLCVDLKAEVSGDTEGLKVNLVGKDTSILIGFHGETLADFSYILGSILRRKLDKPFILRVDAGGYLAGKDKRVTEIAERAIEKVRRSGFPETLDGLNSYERRLVHSVVTKEGLVSESIGYGHERKLTIKPNPTSS
jgi:spoIIIJ-associated protein